MLLNGFISIQQKKSFIYLCALIVLAKDLISEEHVHVLLFSPKLRPTKVRR